MVVQISNDPEFKKDVKTVFNNDIDNICGRGIGKDLRYYETIFGKAIPVKAVKGRYVRLYSAGSSVDDENTFVEVEVFGK